MNTLLLGPESARTLPSYDDPNKYNRTLYSGAEFKRAVDRTGAAQVQIFTSLGNAMLDGIEAFGMPRALTEGTRANLDALGVMSERGVRDYEKPEFGLSETIIDGQIVAVTEEVIEGQDHAFGRLLHFKRETDRKDPPVLIVAPMSGHYATLLRDTVRQLLPYHDVHITDWKNARDVPTEDGEFGLDDYINYLQNFIKEMGPDTNIVAVCQATIPVLAAVSHLAQTDPESQPNSMTLMGGPLDTRVAATVVTEFADKHTIEWFRDNVTTKVPNRFEGTGRLVYPGFMQLASFLGMNLNKHVQAQADLYKYLVDGDHDKAAKLMEFYDEYFSVSDLDRRFYLQTVDHVFKRQTLANGTMVHEGEQINPAKITRTAVFTVEGANDDISAPGQTEAAQAWFKGLDPRQSYHHLQAGVGHYGIFNGNKWGGEIMPRITDFIRRTAKANGGPGYDPVTEESKIIRPTLWHP